MRYNENAFDKIMENYELEDVVTEKIVRSDAVKNSAFEQLGLGEKKKKHFNKKMFGFIAAAAALAVIGTSVIALNPLRDAFNGYIDIKDDVPVYAGDNVQIQSDKSNVELKGVICDDTMVFASLEITKKDGTPFTDDVDNSYIESKGGENNIVFFQEDKPDTNDKEELLLAKCGTVEYKFADEKTIKGFVQCNNYNPYSTRDLQGKTLEVRNGTIWIYHKEKRIYNYNELNKNAKFDYNIYKSQTAKIEEEYKPLLASNEFIKCEWQDHSMYVISRTEVDIDYKISFEVNYTPQLMVLDIDKDKTYHIGESNINLESVEVRPLTVTITVICEGKFEFDRIFGQTIGHKYGAMNIEMKDGRILRVGLEGSFNSGEDEENPNRLIFDLVYCEYYDDDCNMMGINTDDIKAIYFCDEKIYG